MPTLKTITLGCKVNQYETEYLRQGLAQAGYREAAADEAVDLCVVNTCTVTAESDAKSRQAIRGLHRAHPGAEIIVMGCYATRAADALAALPGVVEVVADKRALPALLERRGVVEAPTGISRFESRHRAYVKIQDGCQMACSYCIIPKVRPRLASRPLAEVLDEVRRLVDCGHREIVLTGIHLGHYGLDCKGEALNLAAVVRAMAALPGEFRLRLSSLDATEVTDELLAAMADHAERVCPHLHIALQSGSPAILRRMRRRGTIEQFLDRCAAARRFLDRPALSTDVIVGFPGESDSDFAATCSAVERADFSKLHVFRFSLREGTAAAEFPDRIPGDVQRARAAHLTTLGERLRQEYARSWLGEAAEVLVEAVEAPVDSPAQVLTLDPLKAAQPEMVIGTCRRYLTVSVAGDGRDIGRLLPIRLTAVEGDRLCGERGRGV